MTDRSENIVGMRKKIKAQAEHIRRLEQRIRELKQAEPAPAQDEREAFITAAKHHKVEGFGFNLEATNSGSFRDNETRMLYEGWKLARANRPTQTEQQPVAAQIRYRHPQKTMPDWSAWQQAPVDMTKLTWWIDSVGYENEYRLLYAAPIAQTTKGDTQ